EYIKQQSELVILDSAPLLAVADATVIATQVDGIVLVVDSRTQIDQLQKMQERLTFVPTPLLGYIYNRAELTKSVRYGNYGNYGNGSRNGRSSGGRLRRFSSAATSIFTWPIQPPSGRAVARAGAPRRDRDKRQVWHDITR